MSAVGAALAVVDAERDAREQQAATVAKAVDHFRRVAARHPDWPVHMPAYSTLCAYGHLAPDTFKAVFEALDLAVSEVIAQRFEEATR